MKNFSFPRFAQLLKWDLLMNKKYALHLFLGMFMAFFLLQELPVVMSNGNAEDMTELVMMVLWCYMMFGGCWLFSTMKTQSQRTAFLMQPASNLEKFVVRCIFVTVVWALIAVAAFLLSDLLRVLLSYVLRTGSHQFAFSSFFLPAFSHFSGVPFVNDLKSLFLLGLVWHHSLFLLGGAFFRRHQFIFTALVLFVVSQALTIIGVAIGYNINWDEYTIDMNVLYYYILFGLIAAIILNYVLSYRIFTRMQIINNKWMNA